MRTGCCPSEKISLINRIDLRDRREKSFPTGASHVFFCELSKRLFEFYKQQIKQIKDLIIIINNIAVFNQNVCGFFVRIFFLALPLFLGPFRAPDNPVVFLVCSWWWAS